MNSRSKKSKEITIELGRIKNGRVQNPSRHTEHATRGLCATMSELGLFHRIVVKKRGRGYTIVDGHRRVSSARHLDWTVIDCVVYEGALTEAELWAALNGTLRGISGADWFYGWAMETVDGNAEAFLKRMKQTAASHIRSMVGIFGPNRSIEIGLKGKHSPVIASFANMAYAQLKVRLGKLCRVSELNMGEWFIEFGSNVRRFLAQNPSKKALLKFQIRVLKMQPFPEGDWACGR